MLEQRQDAYPTESRIEQHAWPRTNQEQKHGGTEKLRQIGNEVLVEWMQSVFLKIGRVEIVTEVVPWCDDGFAGKVSEAD